MTVFSFILMLVAYTYEYNYFTEDKKEGSRAVEDNAGYKD